MDRLNIIFLRVICFVFISLQAERKTPETSQDVPKDSEQQNQQADSLDAILDLGVRVPQRS